MRAQAPRRAVTLHEVRGEATSDSDLDLLVDVDRGHRYFDMAGLSQVATPGGLKLRIRDRVLREAVAL